MCSRISCFGRICGRRGATPVAIVTVAPGTGILDQVKCSGFEESADYVIVPATVTKPSTIQERDFVAHLIDEWKRQKFPERACTVFAVVARMNRATAIFNAARERIGASQGLHAGEIMVLDALMRSGPPYCLNPGHLLEELQIASGTMTHWIDRLARRDFVMRTPDPTDRRAVLVHVTPRGLRLVTEMTRQVTRGFQGMVEHAALAAMPHKDLCDLSDLLGKALIALEGMAPPCANGRHPTTREPKASRSRKTRVARPARAPR
jgi:DNA-binding MarR family transcriptional regulator